MKEKFLNESQITQELDNYIYDAKVKYATLLNGPWGCGKTFFIKKYIDLLEKKLKEFPKSSKYKKPVYISLYGITSISELKNKLSVSLIKNNTIKELLPLLDVGMEIGSDFISKNTFVKNSNSKLTKIVNSLYKIKNIIIFFDDLERCSIDINSILGFINELVEHNDVKVIIIADETKIGKNNSENNIELKYLVAANDNIDIEIEKENKDVNYIFEKEVNEQNNGYQKNDIVDRAKALFDRRTLYEEIKEKLIGKTVYYEANIYSVYDVFVNEIITNEYAKKTAFDSKDGIVQHLETNHINNLRSIQYVFELFNRLAKESIDTIKLDKIENRFLSDLFKYCCICVLRDKDGQSPYKWQDSKEVGMIYLDNQSPNFIFRGSIMGFKFVDDYISYSYIDIEKLKITLADYKKVITFEQENPNDPLYLLKKWWTIQEKEIIDIIADLETNISNNYYSLESYSDIIMILSHIEEMDIEKNKIKAIVKNMEKNIIDNKVDGNFVESLVLDCNPKTDEIYNKHIKNIRILSKEKNNKDIKDSINMIFEKDKWGEELKEYCKNNGALFMSKKKFASYLNIHTIIKNIEKKGIDQIYNFLYSLQSIYSFSNIKDYYSDDKNNLEKLRDSLIQLKTKDKVRDFAIKKILEFLDIILNRLQ